MELKRILAKDARSANEKAVALYGKEVMVISCNKAGDQTELIIAVDNAEQASSATAKAAATEPARPAPTQEQAFADVYQLANQPAQQAQDELQPQATPAPSMPTTKVHVMPENADAPLDRLRGQELVSLVRQEIASLRRDFLLSQLGGDLTKPSSAVSLVRLMNEALIECQAPANLRASLLDGIFDCADPAHALAAIAKQLNAALEVQAAPTLLSGIHGLCGPCGAGKTLMTHRIAAAATRELPIEKIALISFADHKPGAWSQTQILAAQTGLEVYRARDLNALTLLLEELGSRQLILIDTAGNDPMRQAQELAQLETPMALHAVMPADASFDQFRRLQSVKELKWTSLMLSKADDLPNPWPMFGFLSAHPLPISAVSSSERSQEGLSSEGLNKLVRWAVDKLQSTLDQIAAAGIQTPAALPTRPATKTPARTTKPRVARTVKSKPAVAKTAAPIACLQ